LYLKLLQSARGLEKAHSFLSLRQTMFVGSLSLIRFFQSFSQTLEDEVQLEILVIVGSRTMHYPTP
jgi:hypothetical protein